MLNAVGRDRDEGDSRIHVYLLKDNFRWILCVKLNPDQPIIMLDHLYKSGRVTRVGRDAIRSITDCKDDQVQPLHLVEIDDSHLTNVDRRLIKANSLVYIMVTLYNIMLDCSLAKSLAILWPHTDDKYAERMELGWKWLDECASSEKLSPPPQVFVDGTLAERVIEYPLSATERMLLRGGDLVFSETVYKRTFSEILGTYGSLLSQGSSQAS